MINEIVKELIENAYENGYQEEIEAMTDEDLAFEMVWDPGLDEDYTFEDILVAVKEFRNVQ